MDHRPRLFRELPPWVWKLYVGAILLGLVYALGSWAWEQLSLLFRSGGG